MSGLSIGAAAKRTRTSPATIRYYEEIGLLRRVGRRANNRRVFDNAEIHRLGFIRRCRDLDFPIERIRILLHLADGKGDCAQARQVALAQAMEAQRRRLELEALEATLLGLAEKCTEGCAAGAPQDCALLSGMV